MSTDNVQLQHAQHRPAPGCYPLSILTHNMASAGNVGSLFRLADALGVERLFLSGTTPQPPLSGIRKTARATDQYVRWTAVSQPLPLLRQLKAQGYTLIALELSTASQPLDSLQLPAAAKVCLLAGAENAGLEQMLLDAADTTVHIPMLGNNSSMNVAMACAIAAYTISRQLRRP